MESTNDISSNKKTSDTVNHQQNGYLSWGVGAFLGTCTAVVAIAASFVLAKVRHEKQMVQNQEFAKKLLNEYKAEQAKGKTVNIDSLINQHVR